MLVMSSGIPPNKSFPLVTNFDSKKVRVHLGDIFDSKTRMQETHHGEYFAEPQWSSSSARYKLIKYESQLNKTSCCRVRHLHSTLLPFFLRDNNTLSRILCCDHLVDSPVHLITDVTNMRWDEGPYLYYRQRERFQKRGWRGTTWLGIFNIPE